MKEAFLIVSRDEAENAVDENGRVKVGAYVLNYLFPQRHKSPAMLGEVARLAAAYIKRGLVPPSAFVFKAR